MLRILLEHLAVAFGAATGVLAGRGKQIDLFGVLVLGLVTATGGGTLRDLILDAPVFWVANSNFVFSSVTAALGMFFVARVFHPSPRVLQVVDAFFLAFVVMVGTSKTWSLGHSWPVCVVMGVVTGVAGGIIRDLLCGQIPLVFRTHVHLYATAAMAGSVVYLLFAFRQPGHPANMVIGAAVILGLRLAAVRWRIHLPEFRTADDESSH